MWKKVEKKPEFEQKSKTELQLVKMSQNQSVRTTW